MAILAVGARSRVLVRAVSSFLLGCGDLLPTSRRASCVNRLPLVAGGLFTALSLHSAIASVRLRSAIAAESQSWGLVPQGNSMPL